MYYPMSYEKMATLKGRWKVLAVRLCIPRISDGIHTCNGSGNIDQAPYRNADTRNYCGQRDHNTVKQECHKGSDNPSHEEKAV